MDDDDFKQFQFQDLYRWWFNAQCENGRMKPIARPWAEVVADPRFQELESRQS